MCGRFLFGLISHFCLYYFQNNRSPPNTNQLDEGPSAGAAEHDDLLSSLSASRQVNRNTDSDMLKEPNSLAATRTTLDDLMETLKKLEEDEKLVDKHDKNQSPKNWRMWL